MLAFGRWLVAAGTLLTAGCGLTTPTKNLLISDTPDPEFSGGLSRQGEYENQIFDHIGCEVATGLYIAQSRFQLPWIEKWGTAITLLITAQDQSGFSPGVSFIEPLRNFQKLFSTGGAVTIGQMVSTGLGGSASANATRSETVQVTWRNSDLLKYGQLIMKNLREGEQPCSRVQAGIFIDGDLRLREFFFDKMQLANTGNLNPAIVSSTNSNKWPLYNTLTEELIFLSSFGGSVTPSWKLARISANTNASLLAAQRTYTNDLIITMGQIAHGPTAETATSLGPAAQNQHNSKVTASAIATSIRAQGL